MSKSWKDLSQHDKIEWLYEALQQLEANLGATQDDLSGLSRRVVDLDLAQKSTYELANEVVATVDRIDSGH